MLCLPKKRRVRALKNSRLKYILSAVSLLLVTALVVLIPYGYSYVNDSIKEGQIYNDGAFSYSAGKLAETYDEIRQLLKSDPVWINEQPKTIDADIYNEVYSAINTLNSAMEGNDYLKEITGYALYTDVAKMTYCTASKVSGVVNDEPMTLNLMTVDLSYTYDYTVIDVILMYNRDNLKVYEYTCNFNVDDSEEYSVYEEVALDKEIVDFADDKLAQYFETATESFYPEIYYDIYSFSIFSFGEAYQINSLGSVSYFDDTEMIQN